jgi:cytochrome c biogenesis protein CcmG, thiol:disulfide interchange protein DsbE
MSLTPAEVSPQTCSLDGEGLGSQEGVMSTKSGWVVPPIVKAVTFWLLLVLLVGIVLFQFDKRATFRGLLVDSVVEPESWGTARAPDIVLPSLYQSGKENSVETTLSKHKGEWVLLNFWATWCQLCREEMPSMEMLQRRFQGKGLQLVTVSVDEVSSEVAKFFGNDKPSFIVLWDKMRKYSSLYGTTKFPESYLIDPDSRVAAKFTGARDWYNQGTVQYFDDVIAKRRPAAR